MSIKFYNIKILIIYLFCTFLSGCVYHGVEKHNNNLPGNPDNIVKKPVIASPEIKQNYDKALVDNKKKKIHQKRNNPSVEETIHNIPKPKKELPSKNIFLYMKDVDIKVILRTLARAVNQSIMISENVKGNANIDIQNEPWNKVFLGLLRTYGLNYEWEGNIIRIITLEDINNEFRYLEIKQKQESKKREIENVAPLKNELIKIKFADANNLRSIFEKILLSDQNEKRGTVMVDKHTNSLIVKATQKDIDAMNALIAKLDQPAFQIRIEARIVEATSDTARELGVEWGGMYYGKGGNHDYWITPGTNTDQGTSSNVIQGGQNSLDIKNIPNPGLIQQLPSVLSENAGLHIGFIAREFGKHVLNLQLSALENQGKLNILSSPSISTLDNQTAVIESGREVPFQTVEDNEVNIEFKKAVLSLEVTPHVIDGTRLKMNILTKKDELDFSSTVEGNPIVITKKAQTNVLLYDGQTTVIGGLRKETDSRSETGIPFLKNIPVLGNFFKRKSKSNNMEEILIFITPHIVKRSSHEILHNP